MPRFSMLIPAYRTRLAVTVNGDKNANHYYHRTGARKKKPSAAADAPVEAHDRA